MDRSELQQAVLEAQAQIQAQAQAALAERMTSLCIKRCIPGPTDKLADRQRRCLDMCTMSFIEGFGVAVSVCLSVCSALRPRALSSNARHPFSRPFSFQSETLASIAKKQASD
jgi:hypothetical protein